MTRAVVLTLSFSLAASVALAQGPVGPEFKVNSYATGYHTNPSVAALGTDRLLVTWTRHEPSVYPVFARLFEGEGTPLGPEFLVSASTSFKFSPSVAVTAGGFVVVWEDNAGPPITIRGRRFDASGNALGAEFSVSAGPTGNVVPRVASASDGSFVVVWGNFLAADGGGWGMFGRRFSAAAVPLGAQFQVNTYTTGDQGSLNPPGLAVAGDGSFAVAWTSMGQDGDGSGVFAQLYDGSGARRGGEFRVNANTTGSQGKPSIAFDAAGGLRVAWSGPDAGDTAQILARRFDAFGAPVGDEYRVSASSGGYDDTPSLVPVAGGRHVVVWEWRPFASVSGALRARTLDAAGLPVGAEFTVGSRPPAGGPDGNASVAAADGVGGFVLAWTTHADPWPQPAHERDVVARRLVALAPAPAAADGGGNGVLEPGESVAFAPAWHNFDETAVAALSGAATAFSGPGGAGLYSLTDGVADYGTIAPGATASCAATSDCYSLSVAIPSSRPVQHWDATLDEMPSIGQLQRWSVHLGDSFTDVPRTGPFYRFVETILHRGVTSGCGGTNFCPASATTREQMSVFTLVAKEGAGYRPYFCDSLFADVPSSNPFCPWIEELAHRGVVGGCGGGNFCPGNPVTRAESAVIVLRTLDPALSPPACGTPVFSDVPASSPFCRWVEELARRAVVGGCGGGRYCPDDPTTREQMAVILSAAFGLTLYGP